MENLNSISVLTPELIALIAGIIILIFFSVKKLSLEILSFVSILLIISILVFVILISQKEAVSIGQLFVSDSFSNFFKMLFCVAIGLTFLFSYRARELNSGVFTEYTLLLFIFYISASFMVMAENLIALYLSMEILSLISYIGVSLNLDRLSSREAGLKYAIFGAVASSLMLFGISYIYGITGSLNYSEISNALVKLRIDSEPIFIMSLLIILMICGGLFFKLAAFPFYAWSPDAYQGGPTTFVALLSTASKAAGAGALIRIMMNLFVNQLSSPDLSNLAIILGVVSLFTMTLGNLMAINQNNLKRLLAYSSIAHAGYIIMALSSTDEVGIRATQFYLIAYLIMNLGAFYCVQIVLDRTGDESIEAFYGMSSKNPYLAAIFAIFLLSLTGIPPFFGFVGKFYLFAAIIGKGGVFYISLAIVGVINSAISLYYYARIIKAMYLSPDTEGKFNFDIVRKVTIGVLGVFTIIFGIFFTPIIKFVETFSGILK